MDLLYIFYVLKPFYDLISSICVGLGLSYLLLGFALNICFDKNNTFVSAFFRIIAFLIYIAIGIFFICYVDFDAYMVIAGISYIAGAILVIISKIRFKKE